MAMNGLDRLRKYAGSYPYTSDTRNELIEIADEIEQDMKENSFYALFEKFAKSIGKPIEKSPILNMHKWLDRWYLPRPVDADRELFDFNKIYDNGCGVIGRINITEYSIGDGKRSVSYDIISHDEIRYAPNILRAEEQDSIEKLRDDMCDSIEYINYDSNAAKEQVNEWLKRAEKLFREDAE